MRTVNNYASESVITGCAGCRTSSTYSVNILFWINTFKRQRICCFLLQLPTYGCLAGGNERETGNS